ncbi:C4-dicarboxylate transporter, substrate-binding protein [Deferribacter desulfuricans SSM1]|uniref:C4-dicarboxylate transporter, substrate-binding protein n=1 Tax=Deferribacter desulfuricans (strain DSM 14783 / JCM 11476 / NBRC 101012 / SSM1) TaxID=639282 RepID=D3PAM9_DEFDS|nr:C4-dicarboxylate transporter, substrate-binding protein [Deferribacter desulfuricans SSM1]
MMKRREFLKKAAVTTAAAGAALSFGAPAVHAKKRYLWKMVTTWPPHFPVFGESAEFIAKWVEKMSDGRLKIQVYGGGELVPPLQAFDAVSGGMVEMGHACAYYWAGKAPATQFFGAVPFGLNSQQMTSWILAGDGHKLWSELYSNFNLVPFLVGTCGVQMGGWFNKEINTINDVKGLKMRIPGLGGKVIAKAGGTAVLSAGGEIYTNLERGVIDATEWVGPYHDYKMGFYKVAKYYYYPGWHEPGTAIEMFVNKKAYEKLPTDLKEIIKYAAQSSAAWMLSEFEAKNNYYLQKLIKEHNVKLKKFPTDVLKTFKKYTEEVLDEITTKDPMSKKVYENYKAFQKNIVDWDKISEFAYLSVLYS